MFKLSTFAFFNLHPQELTGGSKGGSSDVWRGKGETMGPGDAAVSCSGACSAATSGACLWCCKLRGCMDKLGADINDCSGTPVVDSSTSSSSFGTGWG